MSSAVAPCPGAPLALLLVTEEARLRTSSPVSRTTPAANEAVEAKASPTLATVVAGREFARFLGALFIEHHPNLIASRMGRPSNRGGGAAAGPARRGGGRE